MAKKHKPEAKEQLTRAEERQLKFLTQSERLEESEDPKLVHLTLFSISLCIVAFTVWASFTNINEVARAPGEIVPEGFQQSVQHLEGGIIRNILVQEGQKVEAGQTLLIIDGVGSQEDLERAQMHHAALELQRERLRAFIDGREPDYQAFARRVPADQIEDQRKMFISMKEAREKEKNIVRDQIAQKEQAIRALSSRQSTVASNLKITRDMFDRRKSLHESGYVSHMSFLQTQREMNALQGEAAELTAQRNEAASTVSEYKQRLASLDAKYRDDAYRQLESVENELKQNYEIIAKVRGKVDRLGVDAPVSGYVKGLAVNTVGNVVQPGQVLMEIVPQDRPLVVEVRIPPRHIGHIQPGQNVQVKVSAYDFSRYGSIPGTLESISATTFQGEQGDRFYRGRIKLDPASSGWNPEIMPLRSGMTVMSDIITGNKTIMDYLMKPIRTGMQTAFTER